MSLLEGVLSLKTGQAKRHHVIPKFYLNGFALNRKIQVQELSGRAYSASTTNAFVVNNYYAIGSQETGTSLEFEDQLAKIEKHASIALRVLRNDRAIDIEEKAQIAEFILAQWVRGPDFRLSSESFNNLAIRDMARQSTETDLRLFHELSFRRLVSDDDWTLLWKKYTSDNGPEFENEVSYSFTQMKNFTREAIKTFLLIRSWFVLEFEDPILICGDRPVALSDMQRFERSIVTPGLSKADQVVFPLSRTKALVLTLPPKEESADQMAERQQSVFWHRAEPKLGHEINQLIARNAREKIFGHPSDAEYLKQLSMPLNPILEWNTGANWDDATSRMIKLKDSVVKAFKDISRQELAQIIAESHENGGSYELLFRELDLDSEN
ncbi:DUF4238 domain-containing protein [Corynebacterium stationis]|uniref:DUF4238 domain-containing protein n=1 Tax=Corynebacterium stationis TaxID=1705 RepID=UPI0026348C71|nr:DUF4238 domain-containing protein [Corynebacterium stationis]